MRTVKRVVSIKRLSWTLEQFSWRWKGDKYEYVINLFESPFNRLYKNGKLVGSYSYGDNMPFGYFSGYLGKDEKHFVKKAVIELQVPSVAV